MSNTRDEILAALTDYPDGLTSKELAPLCPAAECDPQLVGSAIALLRAEDVIHSSEYVRDGATVWIFGKAPAEKRDPPVSLAGGHDQHGSSASEAARAIARMRGGSTVIRARPPEQPAPAHPKEAVPMQKKETNPERALKVLKAHGGEITTEALAKKIGTTPATLSTFMGTLCKKHGVVRVRRGVYAMNSAAPPSRQPEASTPKVRKPNGAGGYAEALASLKGKRAELEAEISKLDHAIEAIEALA